MGDLLQCTSRYFRRSLEMGLGMGERRCGHNYQRHVSDGVTDVHEMLVGTGR